MYKWVYANICGGNDVTMQISYLALLAVCVYYCFWHTQFTKKKKYCQQNINWQANQQSDKRASRGTRDKFASCTYGVADSRAVRNHEICQKWLNFICNRKVYNIRVYVHICMYVQK